MSGEAWINVQAERGWRETLLVDIERMYGPDADFTDGIGPFPLPEAMRLFSSILRHTRRKGIKVYSVTLEYRP